MTRLFRCLKAVSLVLPVLFGPLAADVAAQVTVPGTYPTIQAAINGVPSGTTIYVQPGTYAEALVVSIQDRSITVRGIGGAAATIVNAAGRNTTALHVLNSTGTIVFEGLTFRNGAQQGTLPGGALLIQNASPAFVNTVFEASSAFDGGGGALFASNASFTGVTFRNNAARRFGGGLYIVSGSHPVFIACDIASNASGTGGAGVGNNGAGGGHFLARVVTDHTGRSHQQQHLQVRCRRDLPRRLVRRRGCGARHRGRRGRRQRLFAVQQRG